MNNIGEFIPPYITPHLVSTASSRLSIVTAELLYIIFNKLIVFSHIPFYFSLSKSRSLLTLSNACLKSKNMIAVFYDDFNSFIFLISSFVSIINLSRFISVLNFFLNPCWFTFILLSIFSSCSLFYMILSIIFTNID